MVREGPRGEGRATWQHAGRRWGHTGMAGWWVPSGGEAAGVRRMTQAFLSLAQECGVGMFGARVVSLDGVVRAVTRGRATDESARPQPRRRHYLAELLLHYKLY